MEPALLLFLSPVLPLTATDKEGDAGHGETEEQNSFNRGEHSLHRRGLGSLEGGVREHRLGSPLGLRLMADHLNFLRSRGEPAPGGTGLVAGQAQDDQQEGDAAEGYDKFLFHQNRSKDTPASIGGGGIAASLLSALPSGN